MLDFYEVTVTTKKTKLEVIKEVSVDFKVIDSEDLMVRGGIFYAVWDLTTNLWSTSAFTLREIVDRDIQEAADKLKKEGHTVVTRYMRNDSSGVWARFQKYVHRLPDTHKPLDTTLAFSNSKVMKQDYVSGRMPYSLETGETPAFDTLFKTLYDPNNLQKIMWGIGSILAGESKDIQKFYVLYGLPGTGKSTLLNLIEQLFVGHVTPIEAGSLTGTGNRFALEALMSNPLVAIDHEADLSRIHDNSMLSSLVSHDTRTIDAKYQRKFSLKLITTLFLASNKPVQITEKGSGITRRLIDVRPTNKKVSPEAYSSLVKQLSFELGAIAYKCVMLYRSLGPTAYNGYVPTDMIFRTNVFFNFVYDNYTTFNGHGWITLSSAWKLYKQYCEDAQIKYRLQRMAFRDEFRHYWKEFHTVTRIEGKQHRSVYVGFRTDILDEEAESVKTVPVVYDWLQLSAQESIFDSVNKDQPAQLGSEEGGTPRYKWANVTTTLKEIDTSKLHYILPPKNLITIDFDIIGEDGAKSLELNLEAAKVFPPTYAEVSKGGSGLHLHYYYDGDVEALSRIYEESIEILKPIGHFSIRRRLSLCNHEEIATITSGLPLKPISKGKSGMVSKKTLATERALRALLLRILRKEVHPNTRPSVDFMEVVLQESYDSGLRYDVSDLKPIILEFASNSTNQAGPCLKIALGMKYASGHIDEEPVDDFVSDTLIFFDVEVFPNLLVVCWKKEDEDNTVTVINPSPAEVEELMRFRLVGFNNRRYDNHILFARSIGYSLSDVYDVSQRIIVKRDRTAFFREAYGISYVDVYDYASIKKSLKAWEITLGLFHAELDLDWDKPVDEDRWDEVAKYCVNDVIATEQVHKHLRGDFQARKILTKLSGLSVNDSTARHAARIIFDGDRNHKSEFVYPDLSKRFPGYEYNSGVSTYRGEVVGEGGYVHAKPGMYNNVVYLDVASMHPTSLVEMNLFGRYTKRFADLMEARLLIKNGQIEEARTIFDGALAPFLNDEDGLNRLSYALKIILNTVYGFTAAKFDNDFYDIRNKDNVVAKRGALFMIDLKNALIERGCNPIHFKTDSVKIANFTDKDILFVEKFGQKYGYTFGIEGIYDKMALVNDVVIIGKWKDRPGWDAVGARFAKPYVLKTLFTKEDICFEDLIETRAVKKGRMYLEGESGEMSFIGSIGTFCPVMKGGGTLYRVNEGKKFAVSATSGYKWLPANVVKELGKEDDIDMSYFESEVEAAINKLSEAGDPAIFLGD